MVLPVRELSLGPRRYHLKGFPEVPVGPPQKGPEGSSGIHSSSRQGEPREWFPTVGVGSVFQKRKSSRLRENEGM